MNKERLDHIEQESLKLIRNVVSNHSDSQPKILTSGGKDSSIVEYLVRRLYPATQGIFNNTTLDCADTYLHIKQVENIHTINPKEGFYQWRKRLNFVPTRFARACCSIFKEGAMVDNLPKENKYIFFLGMRNEESNTRSNYEDMWRNNAWSENWNGCLPIRKWTEFDVWLYIIYREIKVNDKYNKGYSRCGCSCACPFYTKSTWILDKYWYPTMRKRWEDILKEDFITNSKWIIMNCTLDEYVNICWNGGTYRTEPTEEVIQEYSSYSGLDYDIAKKYFQRTCTNGCKNTKGKTKQIKDKDVLAMNMKLYGRQIEKFMCKKCIMTEMKWTNEEWNNQVKRFKDTGCQLF